MHIKSAHPFSKFGLVTTTVGLVASLAGASPAVAATKPTGITTQAAGALTISMSPQMPYDGYVNSHSMTGLDGSIITYIAKKLGLRLSVERIVDFPGALAAAQTCRVDAIVGPVGWTKARAETGLFTDPVYYTPTMLTEQPQLHIDSIATMKGHTIGIPQGYLLIPVLQGLPGVTVKIYPQPEDVYADISAGRLDAAIIDPLSQVYVAKQHPNLRLKNVLLQDPTPAQLKANPGLLDLLPAVNNYLVCRHEPALEQAMSKVIDGMWKDGVMLSFVKQWGGTAAYLKSFPYMTSERVGVDRPKGWTAPTL